LNRTVLFTAAHAHFPDTDPLGGGKAVADFLIRQSPHWQVLSPQTTGLTLPKPLAELSEWEYARFCRQFERVTTAAILQHDPAQCVVLTNDISEGPDFARLGKLGYRLVSIWHVDVVDYFCRMYLRNWVRPERAARWSRYRWLPDVLQLVFHKQADCVRSSARLIVPSAPMKDVILRCYPDCPPANMVVMPWGNLAGVKSEASVREIGRDRPPGCPNQYAARPAACPRFLIGVAPYPAEDEVVIMTLSRLSPEKGIERLIKALRHLDTLNYRVWICGAPAFMQGQRYAAKLRRLAGDRVEFLGHVTGARKAALLQRADLFVSASRHESYGLTIAEAAAAGCRIVSHQHYGAAGTVVDCSQPRELARVLTDLIRAGRTVKSPLEEPTNLVAERLEAVLTSIVTMMCIFWTTVV